ncbi:Uncharacterised protein [Vibrio cholerae]|nr:Uncharacterised protein [Vibrio cholerae]
MPQQKPLPDQHWLQQTEELVQHEVMLKLISLNHHRTPKCEHDCTDYQ